MLTLSRAMIFLIRRYLHQLIFFSFLINKTCLDQSLSFAMTSHVECPFLFLFKYSEENQNFCSWNLECFFRVSRDLPAPKDICYVNEITLFENKSSLWGKYKFGYKHCFRSHFLLSHFQSWLKSQFEVKMNYIQIHTVYEENMYKI